MRGSGAKGGATFRFAELVGSYRLVVTEALLDFIERAFVEPAPACDRERVRQEALDEAAASELCVDPDGTITSRSGEHEFYRVKIRVDDRELAALHFEKAPSFPVTLVLVEPHRLVAHQPNKPPAEFRRLEGAEFRRLEGAELHRLEGSELHRLEGSELHRLDPDAPPRR